MNSTVHVYITFIVSQIIGLTGLLYGYNVYKSTEHFWHFLVLGAGGVGLALLFVKVMYYFDGEMND